MDHSNLIGQTYRDSELSASRNARRGQLMRRVGGGAVVVALTFLGLSLALSDRDVCKGSHCLWKYADRERPNLIKLPTDTCIKRSGDFDMKLIDGWTIDQRERLQKYFQGAGTFYGDRYHVVIANNSPVIVIDGDAVDHLPSGDWVGNVTCGSGIILRSK